MCQLIIPNFNRLQHAATRPNKLISLPGVHIGEVASPFPSLTGIGHSDTHTLVATCDAFPAHPRSPRSSLGLTSEAGAASRLTSRIFTLTRLVMYVPRSIHISHRHGTYRLSVQRCLSKPTLLHSRPHDWSAGTRIMRMGPKRKRFTSNLS